MKTATMIAIAAITLLAACGAPVPVAQDRPSHAGGVVSLLTDDLIQVSVGMRGPATRDDLRAYADCAAAEGALFRGYGFARHLRTTIHEEAGLLQADAVYTVSTTLPAGVKTIDAATQAETCQEMGIPRV